MAVASVIIPAHNEAASIGRNLRALREGTRYDDLDVVVVCNGCTDDTAEVARQVDPHARVIEIPQPSKAEAVRVGNAATDVFPRVHLGRGVVVLSEQAQARVTALPRMMSDDLGMSDSFSGEERRVVPGAVAVVRPPRTVRDLVRRRIRVATGNAQAGQLGVRRSASRTSVHTPLVLAVARPGIALRLPVFVGVHIVARLGARRALRSGDLTTWHRDESSRA